jgi:sn-glycerol 3-phosphate transport system substrate-binding protein
MRKLSVVLLMVMVVMCLPLFAGGQAEAPKKDADTTLLRYYFPVGVAGPLAQLMDGLIKDYNTSQKAIYVEAIFAGGYREALDKTMTAFHAGNPPDFAVMDAPNLLTFIAQKMIIPLDPYIAQAGGKAFLDGFTPGFMKVGEYDNKVWSIPFQRSTPILYYNKDFFREAGLNPDKSPENWTELADYAAKLTKLDASGKVSRYGLMVPNIFWVINPLVRQAGGEVENPQGTKISIDTPAFAEVYGFLHDLTYKKNVMPGISPWAQAVSDFAVGKTAMLYHTTGSLTFIRNSTSHNFGTGFLPMHKKRVVIEGGGNLFVLNTGNEKKQKASWEVINWLVKPEVTLKWAIGSGYIPVTKAAFNLPDWKAYVEKVPQAMAAYNQLLQVPVERNMTTYRMQEIYDLLNRMDERIRGSADPKMIATALSESQAEANKILEAWK